jgi:hypothetical protein
MENSANKQQALDAIRVLLASGLTTDWRRRADTTERFDEVRSELRASDGSLQSKLQIAGFTDHPVEHDGVTQSCESCMYYLVHARWCDLPELRLPVEADWSCNVWRI